MEFWKSLYSNSVSDYYSLVENGGNNGVEAVSVAYKYVVERLMYLAVTTLCNVIAVYNTIAVVVLS